MCDRGSIRNLNMGGLFHEDPIERSIIMGKITKKEIKKLLKAARKKEFRKCIEDQIIKEANQTEKLRQQLKEKLVALSRMAKN